MRRPRPNRASFEAIEPTPASSFAAFRHSASHFRFVWHFHPELEMTLIVRGSGLRFVGESIEPYGPGDLVLIGANVPHTWQSSEPCGRGNEVETIVIQFRPELFETSDHAPVELRHVEDLMRRAGAGLRVDDAQTRAEVTDWMNQIVAARVGSVERYTGLLRALDALARDVGLHALSSPLRSG